MNIRSKTASELLGKLDNNQAAPPLFLLAERGLCRTLGGSELSLRLLPFVAGLLSVGVVAIIARRVIGQPWELLLLLLFGASETLIWHATEAKPYGTDVFAALLLTWLALHYAMPSDTRSSERSDVAGLGGFILCSTAAVLAWLSYPSIFIRRGEPHILTAARAKRWPRGWITFVAGNALVAISFLIVLLVCVRRQQSSSLVDLLERGFPGSAASAGLAALAARRTCNRFVTIPWRASGPAHAAAMICRYPVDWSDRDRWTILGILAGPILLTLLAAAAQRYPFDGARLTAFLMPSVLLLAVIGCQWIAGSTRCCCISWAGSSLQPPMSRSSRCFGRLII